MKGAIIRAGMITALLTALFLCSCLDQSDSNSPEQERAKLNEYLDALVIKGYDIDTTQLGIYYIELEPGNGPYPKKGDLLTMEYVGYFFNGTVFDTSDRYKADGKWQFSYLNPAMIKGWDDGVALMNEGRKLYLIVPSSLAYGASGYGIIPSYTTIVFTAKMIDIESDTN